MEIYFSFFIFLVDIMDIVVREIKNEENEINRVKEFLFNQINAEYHIGPTAKFHYDIFGLNEYYIAPTHNNFFVAFDGDKIVATIGIRVYDKDFEFFKGIYSSEDTASIWRLMVDRNYRRKGIARLLVNEAENFARNAGYDRIYLHTHRYLESGLPFWKSVGYAITVEEEDYDETTHMEKLLNDK